MENRLAVVVVAAVVDTGVGDLVVDTGVGVLLTIQNVVVGFNGGLGLVKAGRRC